MTDRDRPLRLTCPKCKHWTSERTSTNNGFCRACDYIFASNAPVTLTQEELAALAIPQTEEG